MTSHALPFRNTLDLLSHTNLLDTEDHVFDMINTTQSVAEHPIIVSWVNAHAVMLAKNNPAFSETLSRSDLIFRDGIGVSILLRMLGTDPRGNMNGTDLIPYIVRAYEGRSIALLGTVEPYLSQAAEAFGRQGARIVATMDGFQDPQAYVKCLDGLDVDLVVLGMGMPKQEGVAALLAERIAKPCVILNGGAILDFMAGRFPRAPRVWRQLKLEWLFRVILEPKRLWRRYLLGGVGFVAHAAQTAIAARLARITPYRYEPSPRDDRRPG
ncbi:WecB/TagA/CpsF family glycosyltransferase [Paraburkholderia sediminicola]|jgi:exopolysaccharide biosynthesis WecB/TagA/CpsF family protein|uniref:WecB/TagA/CpsF family glycosyltransferase n=1 Tax=Paraburkholderia sediminicola TaxID=458836 RepID=UPI0038B93BB3